MLVFVTFENEFNLLTTKNYGILPNTKKEMLKYFTFPSHSPTQAQKSPVLKKDGA